MEFKKKIDKVGGMGHACKRNLNCGQFHVIPHNHYAREKIWSCNKLKKLNRTSPKMATALVWQALFLCLLGDHVPWWSHWTTWVWLLLLCWLQNLRKSQKNQAMVSIKQMPSLLHFVLTYFWWSNHYHLGL